ncbi:hypothetical protein ACFO3I_05510 [Rheinheimera marina]|uniref:Adhesin domain-containing protein n=1 Tax=Rheinheimera marina TaxID=1774958 RepID=A0ABV9JIE2_9GAMM
MFKLTFIAATVLWAGASFAADSVQLQEQLDSKDLHRVELDVAVGQVDIQVVEGTDIKLDVELEPDNNWLGFGPDLSDARIEMRQQGDKVKIRIELDADDDDVKQSWTIQLPQHLALALDLGVGSIDIDGMKQDAKVDVGVGDVDFTLDTRLYQSIELDAGVGDTGISGGAGRYQTERAMVTSNSKLSGSGTFTLKANVGVGDIKVKHQQ